MNLVFGHGLFILVLDIEISRSWLELEQRPTIQEQSQIWRRTFERQLDKQLRGDRNEKKP